MASFCVYSGQLGDNGDVELVMDKASSINAADEQLDEDGDWDQLEYAPLADIGSGKPPGTTAYFIATLVEVDGTTEASEDESMIVAKFQDEEKDIRTFWVHETHTTQWKLNSTYVIHRAKIENDIAKIPSTSMLSEAPADYVWTGEKDDD